MAVVNYVSTPRPRPGLDLSGWQLVPSGVAVSDPGPDSVLGLARVTSTGGPVTGFEVSATGVPGSSGDTAYGRLWVRSTAEFTPVFLRIDIYSSATKVDSVNMTPSAIAANTWTEIKFELFASTTFDEVRLTIGDTIALASGESMEATMAIVSLEDVSYFDGATPNDLDQNGRGWVYEWTGQAWESSSIRRYGFVGILTATWDPELGGVHLIVDGGMWPSPVSQLRIERSAAGEATVPIRGVEKIWAPGGGYVGTDHEMPINTIVEYTVYGYDKDGNLITSSTAVVDTPVDACTLYIKAPGNADLTQKPILRGVGGITSATRGGAYQIAAGGALGQDAGGDTRRVTITVGTRDAGEAQSLEGLLSVARTVLVQDGNENPEIPNGWWTVSSWERTNAAQLGFGAFDYRAYALELTATQVPAGVGVRTTGTTWGALMTKCATWQDVIDTYPTWLDVVLSDEGGGL